MVDKWILAVLCVLSVVWCGANGQTCTKCGNDCCTSNETCDNKLKRCFKTADRIDCSHRYYCYKPMTCCGFGSCCPDGSTCRDSRCETDSSETLDWIIFRCNVILGVGILLVMSVAMLVFCIDRKSRAKRGQVTPCCVARTPVASCNIPFGTAHAVNNTVPKPATRYPHTPYIMSQNRAPTPNCAPNNTSSQLNVNARTGSVAYIATTSAAVNEPFTRAVSKGSTGRPAVCGYNGTQQSYM